ncbi:GNAT family N-acetyltransferase [Caldalkalibacillus mannanilyticus]|uniref:GNAT family N-acetyltransferase n=1 Tax=Caldalkalibacillus mannanilyticus TaxID=1418 RepID=UPI000469D7C2|nr:GNAT family N-acetyltransferase [Caldalkalibacillus mannanilyticus]
MEEKIEGFMISTDKSLLDIEAITEFLGKSYWANQRTQETIIKSIENSLCYGVYENGKQVGFARVVTDGVTMYWLCDVYIDERYRGVGIGKKLISTIIHSEELKNLNGILGTLDAHGLYEQYGFIQVQDRFMRRKAQ